MKQIVLGMIGILTSIYVVLIGLNIYSIQREKEKLEDSLSQSVENALVEQFVNGNQDVVQQQLETDIKTALSYKQDVSVLVQALDLEKGLLSVKATEKIPLITGTTKTIALEKTAIMDRIQLKQKRVTVQFIVDGEVYKQFQLTKGEECPMPKPPAEVFVGWVEYGTDSILPVEAIGQVWEDKVFLAITE